MEIPTTVYVTSAASLQTAPHQIWLDEDQGVAYTVEYAPAGRLLRIDLNSGTQTVVAADWTNAFGLVLTNNRQQAYISEQAPAGCRLVRINLAGGGRETVKTGLVNPFFLTWTDAGESGLLITERDPANRINRLALAVVAGVSPSGRGLHSRHPGGLWPSLAALTPLATAAYTGHGATGSAIPRAIRERTEACGGGRRTTGSILQAGAAPASDH